MGAFHPAQRAELTGVLGRTPTSAELAIAHQQGAGSFSAAHEPDWQGRSTLVGGNAVTQNNGDPNMTRPQFAHHLAGDYGGGRVWWWAHPPGRPHQERSGDRRRYSRPLSGEGLNIRPAYNPGQRFGRTATANAQPFSAIVQHHTAGPDLHSALNTAQGDPARGGTPYGYHFLIEKTAPFIRPRRCQRAPITSWVTNRLVSTIPTPLVCRWSALARPRRNK